MTLMQTLQQIGALQREIQEQLRVIDAFARANRDNLALVRTELQGSTKGYDTRMIQSLDKAEASLRKSSAALQAASESLQRVRTI